MRKKTVLRLGAACLAGLLTAGVIGELALSAQVEGRLGSYVECYLPKGARLVDVSTSGLATENVLRGDVDELVVKVQDFPFRSVRADVTARAQDVRLRPSGLPPAERVEAVAVSADIPVDGLETFMVGRLPDAATGRPELGTDGEQLTVAVQVGPFPATVHIRPDVEGGTLTFTPTAVQVGNRTLAPEMLTGLIGDSANGAAAELLRTRSVPFEGLPEGAELTDVHTTNTGVRVEIGVTGSALSDGSSQPCAPGA